jgi:apolipoprotein N-acyltransferase
VKLPRFKNLIPDWQNALLAVLSAVLLILAFPDFEFWFLAWFALVPLLFAIERESKSSPPGLRKGADASSAGWSASGAVRSFVLGWIFGVVFFSGTCWWLTYAPIHYAGFPIMLAYFLLFCVTAVAAIFPGIFGLLLSIFLRRFGTWAFLLAPFVWVFTDFLRYWITGNNWNAVAYSQAFVENPLIPGVWTAAIGGVLLSSGVIVAANAVVFLNIQVIKTSDEKWPQIKRVLGIWIGLFALSFSSAFIYAYSTRPPQANWNPEINVSETNVIVVQPNVPMSGLDQTKWEAYRRNHIRLAESAIQEARNQGRPPSTVVFPESPMNFMYGDDPETKAFINSFAAKNNVSVLFNSAEPNKADHKYFNSAVLVGPEGKMIGQYDKIYLLPFGEAVPTPLQSIVPAFVGSFSYGSEYDILPIGDGKAGVMICFESHFGALSREYVRNGADVIIEMTNDGYLGPTPVLRQHLANAVFRAVETNREVLRATNVGITERIAPNGDICDSLIRCGPQPYTEATRVWSVSKSDGSQTLYVKYGDWFAWLCSIVTMTLLIFGLVKKSRPYEASAV